MRTNIENLLKDYQYMHTDVVLKLINIHLNGSSSILLMEKALLEHMINNLKVILELDEIKTLIEQKEKELENLKNE